MAREHDGALKRFLRTRIASEDKIEDVGQESYLRVLKADSKGKVTNPRAYLFRTALNVLHNLRRTEKRRSTDLTETVEEESLAGVGPSPEENVLARDLRLAYEKSMRKLPHRCQLVFYLRRQEGMNTEQIAGEMGISRRTVQKYLAQALAHLHGELVVGVGGDGEML